MNVPGHLAAAYFLARRGAPLRVDRLGVIALGALLPDLMDKPLMWIGATPYGRTVGHSLLLWCTALTLWVVVRRRSITSVAPLRDGISTPAYAWSAAVSAQGSPYRHSAPLRMTNSALLLLGGFSHLAVDLIDDVAEGLERSGYVFSAWMGWPVTNPDMAYVQLPHVLEPMRYAVTAIEMATVAACLWHAVSRRD